MTTSSSQGLREILAGDPGIDVVAACSDLGELFESVAAQQPDVVVTDIRMPPSNTDEGIRVASELRRTHPNVGVVVLSQYSEPAYVLALLESGSDGRAYLLDAPLHDRQQLASTVEAVAQGGSVIEPKIVEVLVSARARPRARRSRRQTRGAGAREIAQGKRQHCRRGGRSHSARERSRSHTHAIFVSSDCGHRRRASE